MSNLCSLEAVFRLRQNPSNRGVRVGARVYAAGAITFAVGARVYGNLVISVSALGPKPSFFLFWEVLFNLGVCWDRGLDLDLD